MKTITIIGLIAAQLATPAAAAELAARDHDGAQRGAFVGGRLALPLGPRTAQPRLGLALAPMARSRETGALALGAGLDLALASNGRLAISAGGRPLALDRTRRQNVSTAGWIAIGVGTVLVIGTVAAAVTYAELVDCDEHDDEC